MATPTTPISWEDAVTVDDIVREALSSVDFPADKQSLVQQAADAGASEQALRLLRALPLGTYANKAEVLRSIPRDPDEEEGLSPAELARRARERTGKGRGRVAEHLRQPKS
ncbi:DUF2795 domain-containing protein [Microbispora hainanensis]|uniref:DUF2795 domain-containing protein n=1 Tax=Microbispora hainanensis TaxID=568844 RepID=UPI001FCBE93A|nr:DUF2795 domain-containing protein [Microbispora hainanensis]